MIGLTRIIHQIPQNKSPNRGKKALREALPPLKELLHAGRYHTGQSVLFSDRDLFGKPLVATFDQPHACSDSGAILVKAADARLRLSERLSACLNDGRQAGKVSHSLQELLRQRLFAIACGYPDGNDAARCSIHKLSM